jgi:hypothetical protein
MNMWREISGLGVVAFLIASGIWPHPATRATSEPQSSFLVQRNSEARQFVVAGCVPQHVPFKIGMGSIWVACNDPDSELAGDKVVETRVVSCLDMFSNGVISGLFIDEVSNRKWQSFRFSCRNLNSDGTLGAESMKSADLVNFSGKATHFQTVISTNHVALGIFEVYNKLQFRESLLSVGLENQSANAIYNAAQKGKYPADVFVSPRVPKSSPQLIGTSPWRCPVGKVLTGASLGHIPDNKKKWTRAVFIKMECYPLMKGTRGER